MDTAFLEVYCNEFSDEERKIIPHIKRFFECFNGDDDFRSAVEKNPAACKKLMESRGIFYVDPLQIMLCFDEDFGFAYKGQEDLLDFPQLAIIKHWQNWLNESRNTWRGKIEETSNEKFNIWRRIQINRCGNQMPSQVAYELSHAVAVFELSKGCSINCPFCGISAGPLKDVFEYSKENRKIWKDVLKMMAEKFGQAVGFGSCYWATDPSDNPDYFKFLNDFNDIIGIRPQTTTAGFLKNLDWTRKLIEFSTDKALSYDRFSVLSKNMLIKLHENFSAEELDNINLILQFTESAKDNMAISGRNKKSGRKNDDVNDYTIACVTGYLINMTEKSVKLISPYPPSQENPYGYHVFEEGWFDNAQELRKFIEYTIEKYMNKNISGKKIMKFRKDLQVIFFDDGFQIRNKYKSYKMVGKPYFREMGELISKGKLSFSDLLDNMSEKYPDILSIMNSLDKLYRKGLFEEY